MSHGRVRCGGMNGRGNGFPPLPVEKVSASGLFIDRPFA